ncbi:hypothetical protein V8D89_000963, partial [Ganoderma adspersum]
MSLSSSIPVSSTALGASSQSGVSIPNTSTSPEPTPTHRASPMSGLSAGAAVGLALGVFVAMITLAAAALFLFLRRRRRKRSKRNSAGSYSSRRQLTSPVTDVRSSICGCLYSSERLEKKRQVMFSSFEGREFSVSTACDARRGSVAQLRMLAAAERSEKIAS